jgi:hypothetical protein
MPINGFDDKMNKVKIVDDNGDLEVKGNLRVVGGINSKEIKDYTYTGNFGLTNFTTNSSIRFVRIGNVVEVHLTLINNGTAQTLNGVYTLQGFVIPSWAMTFTGSIKIFSTQVAVGSYQDRMVAYGALQTNALTVEFNNVAITGSQLARGYCTYLTIADI